MHTISFLAACNKGLILTLESKLSILHISTLEFKPSLTLESKLSILHISTLEFKVTKETIKEKE
jgi:hypothetical protein